METLKGCNLKTINTKSMLIERVSTGICCQTACRAINVREYSDPA